MGIYTSNRYFTEAHDYASEIPANNAYGAALGCAQIMADCQANDMALFESAIYSDFAEIKALQEGVSVVNENAFTNVIKKIVEMFKKLIAKIKGIFAAFIAKLTGAFKNGKDLVKKYEKQIIKYSNWKDFKCKNVRIPKNGDDIKSAIDSMFAGNSRAKVCYTATINNKTIALDTQIPSFNDADKIKDADSEDIRDAIMKLYIDKVTSVSELHETVMDELFESEETLDGDDQVKSASYFSKTWIKTILADDKWEKDVKRFNEVLEKNINTIIDNLNKTDDAIAKFMTNKDNKANTGTYKRVDAAGFSADDYDDADSHGNEKAKKSSTSSYDMKPREGGADPESMQKAVHALQKMATNEQEVITKVTAEYMTVVKFALAQARKVWTAAAAWSSGVHKESVEYVQAVGESAAEQFYSIMEAVH